MAVGATKGEVRAVHRELSSWLNLLADKFLSLLLLKTFCNDTAASTPGRA